MRTIWEIDDVKPGTRVRQPLGDSGFADFIIANYFPGGPVIYGIFAIKDGEFIKVGSGSKEAVLQYLTNCGFRLLEG